MIGKKTGIHVFLRCLVLAGCLSACTTPMDQPDYPAVPPSWSYPFRFAVIGNTCVAADPARAQAHILEAIRPEYPVFVLVAGNLVADGGSRRGWDTFDEITEPLRDRGIPIVPARGILDLGGGNPEAARNWGDRFHPLGKRTWFTLRFKNVLVVTLDTNLKALGLLRKEQEAWLERTLRIADREANVNFVFILMYHAPFSNADAPVPKDVLRTIVPLIEKTRKAHVVFSASGGTVERIHRGDRWWVSTGGGGGPRTAVEVDPSKRRYIDAFPGGPVRPFHFIRVTVEATRFILEVVALGEDGKSFSVTDRVVVSAHP